MEEYTVPKEVLAELRPKDTTRNVYAADHIRECTNLCRQLGLVAGIRDFNRKHPDMQVGASSAKRWLGYWKEKHTYYSPMKRGGDFHLSPEIEAEVLEAFTKIRHRSEYSDSEQVCSIARGIVRKHKLGATLASEGGANVFSDWWGRCFLCARESWVSPAAF